MNPTIFVTYALICSISSSVATKLEELAKVTHIKGGTEEGKEDQTLLLELDQTEFKSIVTVDSDMNLFGHAVSTAALNCKLMKHQESLGFKWDSYEENCKYAGFQKKQRLSKLSFYKKKILLLRLKDKTLSPQIVVPTLQSIKNVTFSNHGDEQFPCQLVAAQACFRYSASPGGIACNTVHYLLVHPTEGDPGGYEKFTDCTVKPMGSTAEIEFVKCSSDDGEIAKHITSTEHYSLKFQRVLVPVVQ